MSQNIQQNKILKNSSMINEQSLQTMQFNGIDKQNLQLLICSQYLKNYTYVQYSLFPDLFVHYLTKLSVSELKVQLNLYVSTFLQFFSQSTIYEKQCHSMLAHEIMLKYNCDQKGQFQAKLKKFSQRLNQFIIQSVQFSTTSATQINHEQESLQRGIKNLESILHQLKQISLNNHINNDILKQVSRKSLSLELLRSISLIIQQLINKGASHLLYDWSIPCYIYTLALRQILDRLQKKFGSNIITNNQQQYGNVYKYRQFLLQLIHLTIIPFQLQFNSFYEHIVNAGTKEFYLMKQQFNNKEGKIPQWYLELVRDLARVNQFVEKRHIKQSDGQLILIQNGKQLQQVASTQIVNKKRFINIINQIQLILTSDSSSIKQFTNQNVQKITKFFTRMLDPGASQVELHLQRNNRMQVQGQFNEQMMKGQINCYQTQYLSHKNIIKKSIPHTQFQSSLSLQSLSQECLQSYLRIVDLVDSLTGQQTLIQQKLAKGKQIQCHLQYLMQQSNKDILQILRFDVIDLRNLQERLYKLSNKLSFLIQLIARFEQSQSQSINKIFLSTKISKIKSSAYVNILSIRILKSTFCCSDASGNKENDGSQIQNNQQYSLNLSFICRFSDIIQLFTDIFQLILQSIKHRQQQQSFINHNKTQLTKSQIQIYPSLKNILFLFSSIQIWNEFQNPNKHPKKVQMITSQNKQPSINTSSQISQFFQSVIRKYSQPQVKIDKQQIFYVNYIISMCEFSRNIYVDNGTQNIQTFISQLKRIIELSQLCDNKQGNQMTIKLEDILNIGQNNSKYLRVLYCGLWGYVFPSIKQQKQGKQNVTSVGVVNNDGQYQDDEQQTHQLLDKDVKCKINFWKSLTYDGRTLNQSQIAITYCQAVFNQLSTITGLIKDLINKQKIQSTTEYNNNNKVINVESIKPAATTITNQINLLSNQQVSMDNTIKLLKFMLQSSASASKAQKQTSINKIMKLFKTFNSKYVMTKKLKKQLNKKRQQQSKFNQVLEQAFDFVLDLGQQLVQKSLQFNQILIVQKNCSQLNKYKNQKTLQQTKDNLSLQTEIQTFLSHLKQLIIKTIQFIQQRLITPKLTYYKISPSQIQTILVNNHLYITQSNKQKVIQITKCILEYLDKVIDMGITSLAYLFWIKSEVQLKLINTKDLSSPHKTISKTNNKRDQSSTLSLLRWIILSGMVSDKLIEFNFWQVQNILTSRVQSKTQQHNQLNSFNQQTQLFNFPLLKFNNPQIIKQLKHVKNIQFLQFLYEYFPFQINSYQEQMELLQFSTIYTKQQQNHQFVTGQKLEKIRFLNRVEYLECLKDKLEGQ